MSVLLPQGVTHIADAPHTLIDAIVAGLQFLQFMELPKDEQPPRRIWLDAKKLNAHFRAVEKRRKEKYGDGDDEPREIDDPVDNGFKLIADE